MFTGLVESTGTLVSREAHGNAGKLTVRSARPFRELQFGESIAVNGCCLTLEKAQGELLVFHTLAETLSRTNLGELPLGATVNLERALMVGARLGGHMVSGHIDATGTVLRRSRSGDDEVLAIRYPAELGKYLVPKGSIAIDGVSLTLLEVTPEFFSVALIPVTLAETALVLRRPGAAVNLESDLVGKYVYHQLLQAGAISGARSGVTMDTLLEAGFL